jgi:hypothetical protein
MNEITPMDGWIRSLPRVLLLPFAVWGLLGVFFSSGNFGSSVVLAGYAAVVGMLIHFLSYLVLGIPLYLVFWEKKSRIWEWPFGLPLGVALGTLTLLVFAVASSDEPAAWVLVLGGGYGGLTAIGACWSRKRP